MQTRVVVALSLSLILIVAASWSRFFGESGSNGNLLLVENTTSNDHYEEVMQQFLKGDPANTVSPENLSSTDLIGRQLVLDYVSLARNGQATEANLTALTEKYVESIPTLMAAQKINLTDLNVVSNDKANFQKYAGEISIIYSEYASGLLKIYSGEESSKLGIFSVEVSGKMTGIYSKTAAQLQAQQVPASLAQAHLDLINVYLENAFAMESLVSLEDDPARAFAGLLAAKKNVSTEAELLAEIERDLKSNGI